MKRIVPHLVPALIFASLVALALCTPRSQAQNPSQTINLAPGSSAGLTCPTTISTRVSRDRKQAVVTCAPTPTPSPTPTPTPSPTPSPTPGQPCPAELHDANVWHPPVHPSGCYYGHEHGDAPPQWVQTSPWMPMFSHAGNTPGENVYKHTGFKGFSLRDDGIDVYVIMHLDTNPNGHTSRFHSYQVWAKDTAGNISYWDLWADFGEGNNTGPNVLPVDTCGVPQSTRPIMSVNFPECPIAFETWYSRAGAPEWGWDLGFNVKPQYYHGPAQGQSSNPDLGAINTWLPTGLLNDTRRIELAWYAFRPHPTGRFYSTQFGEIVTGPTDPVCGTQRTIGNKTYTVLCLEQYIAPTMTTFSFPGNSVQKDYDSRGVVLPN